MSNGIHLDLNENTFQSRPAHQKKTVGIWITMKVANSKPLLIHENAYKAVF